MRAPARRYYSDVSFTAIGGVCPELKVYWRYSLAEALTRELKKQSATKQAGSITINLLELLIGMMMSAFMMQMTGNDRPEYAGDTVLLRGDNVSAAWMNNVAGPVTSATHW